MKNTCLRRVAPLILALGLIVLSLPCSGNEFTKTPVRQAQVITAFLQSDQQQNAQQANQTR